MGDWSGAGRPGREEDERVKAAVVTREGADLDELPKGPTGKIEKTELQ